MKKLLLLIFSIFVFASIVWAKPEKSIDIVQKGLDQGNVMDMAKVFDNTIDITFADNQAVTYSKTQATAILKRFFAKSIAKNFKLMHRGKSTTNNTIFAIGTLYTSTENYRVYLFFVPKNGSYFLKELRFEKL